MRRATYTWFNRWFEMKDAGDDETSQAVEPDADAVRHADRIRDDVVRRRDGALADAADWRHPSRHRQRSARRTSGRGSDRCSPSTSAPAARCRAARLGRIRKPGYRAEYFEFTSDREIRIPGWLLTPDNATASTPTVLYLGEGVGVGLGCRGSVRGAVVRARRMPRGSHRRARARRSARSRTRSAGGTTFPTAFRTKPT